MVWVTGPEPKLEFIILWNQTQNRIPSSTFFLRNHKQNQITLINFLEPNPEVLHNHQEPTNFLVHLLHSGLFSWFSFLGWVGFKFVVRLKTHSPKLFPFLLLKKSSQKNLSKKIHWVPGLFFQFFDVNNLAKLFFKN